MQDIHIHWNKIVNELQEILPRNGGFYNATFRTGDLSTSLVCQNYRDEVAIRYNEFSVPVVPFLETVPGDSPVYWLAWYEEWGRPKRRASQGRQQFKSSSIIIYYGNIGERKRQVLRAEWAGPDDYDSKKKSYVHQGKSAGHPHWHIDGLHVYINELRAKWEKLANDFELNKKLAVDTVREFGDDQAEKDVSQILSWSEFPGIDAADELAWAGIHLASNARWSEKPWAGPKVPHDMHANVPTDCAQVRRWLTSCVRYLQVELEDQLLKARA